MTTLQWTSVAVHNRDDLLSIESVYKKYGALSGIHGFEFSDNFNTFVGAHWTTISNVSYSDSITATGTTPGSDTIAWYDTDMPHSYSLEFTSHVSVWGVILRGNNSSTYYEVKYDYVGGYINIYSYDGGFVIKSWSIALDANQLVTAGRVKIAVSDAQYTSDSTGRALYITIWVNDNLIYSMADSLASVPPLRFGFLIPASSAAGVLYSDFRIPNLGEILPFSSLDPGANPISAIQLAVEDRYIRAWMRWNGKLKAYIPSARSNTITISADREFGLTPSTDYRQAFSHVRVVGAFQWIQDYDADLVKEIGHRFAEINNTALWNTDDCQRLAKQLFIRVKEQVFQADINTIGMVYSELEDRIRLPDHTQPPGSYLDYIIDNIQWDWVKDTFKASLQARRYWYG